MALRFNNCGWMLKDPTKRPGVAKGFDSRCRSEKKQMATFRSRGFFFRIKKKNETPKSD